MYDNKPTPAHGIDVTARVRADDGRVVFNSTRSDRAKSCTARRAVSATPFRIPLQGWTPGLYVLEVEAKSRLSDAAPVTRVIQFEVK